VKAQRPPRPRTKCRRCHEAYRDHTGPELRCFGRDTTFHRPPPRLGTSVSLAGHEVEAVAELLAALEQRDTRKAQAVMSVRKASLASVHGKLQRMRARREARLAS
jgi:hypothetical protein